MTITITDETLTGDILNRIELAVENERISVKDIIAARVEYEVNAYNKRLPEYFKGLIQPSDAEKTINGFRMKKRDSKIDVEKQVFIAYDAFQKNGYFVIIDDQQADDLEQEVLVNSETSISFIKLTPLVGG
ncbi:hypothetical protein [Aestuariibaculum sediminum]|uniref:Uncharacterized protein n=1 Tax=Aestuariibaculum sediminum TaxID=2770637 RepID=A0A8J6UFN5_9FLAO|nr:hypothetical protein [Aestuariibaculum sediminum]MBD0831496.1 hypothetical protein [Aestuariibaculum sediminum]